MSSMVIGTQVWAILRRPKEKYLIQQYHTEGWKYVNSMAHCYQVTALKTSASIVTGTTMHCGGACTIINLAAINNGKQLTGVCLHC